MNNILKGYRTISTYVVSTAIEIVTDICYCVGENVDQSAEGRIDHKKEIFSIWSRRKTVFKKVCVNDLRFLAEKMVVEHVVVTKSIWLDELSLQKNHLKSMRREKEARLFEVELYKMVMVDLAAIFEFVITLICQGVNNIYQGII